MTITTETPVQVASKIVNRTIGFFNFEVLNSAFSTNGNSSEYFVEVRSNKYPDFKQVIESLKIYGNDLVLDHPRSKSTGDEFDLWLIDATTKKSVAHFSGSRNTSDTSSFSIRISDSHYYAM